MTGDCKLVTQGVLNGQLLFKLEMLITCKRKFQNKKQKNNDKIK